MSLCVGVGCRPVPGIPSHSPTLTCLCSSWVAFVFMADQWLTPSSLFVVLQSEPTASQIV